MAPEILKGNQYDVKVDVYSLGVVLYSMLCGIFPYFAVNQKELEKKIIGQKLKFQNINYQKIEVSEKTVNLIQKMLKYVVNDRISFEDLNEYINTYYTGEEFDPNSLKIKEFEFFNKNNDKISYEFEEK